MKEAMHFRFLVTRYPQKNLREHLFMMSDSFWGFVTCFSNLNLILLKIHKKFMISKLPSQPKTRPNLNFCFLKNTLQHDLYSMFPMIASSITWHKIESRLLTPESVLAQEHHFPRWFES